MSVNFNRKRAVDYAHQFCMSLNPRYPNWIDEDGDCTNFVSQCWADAGIPITGYWYCKSKIGGDFTGTWTDVDQFATYMTEQGYCSISNNLDDAELGDVVQLYNSEHGWHHSVIITRIDQGYLGKKLYFSGHNNARYDEPLSNVSEIKRLLRVYAF